MPVLPVQVTLLLKIPFGNNSAPVYTLLMFERERHLLTFKFYIALPANKTGYVIISQRKTKIVDKTDIVFFSQYKHLSSRTNNL